VNHHWVILGGLARDFAVDQKERRIQRQQFRDHQVHGIYGYDD
jgi:hypothetical protein